MIMKNLQNFLIKRFIILLVLVGGIEFWLNQVINEYFFPVMKETFLPDVDFREGLSGGQVKIIMLFALLQLFFNLINRVIPFLGSIGTEAVNKVLTQYYADSSKNNMEIINLI